MASFRNKNVLITGGAGFIGSNLAHKLVEQEAKITIVDSMIPQYGGTLCNLKGIEDKIHINFSDIRDTHSLAYLIQNQNYIFSLAGQLSHIDSMTDPFTDLSINCTSQLSLLESCRKHNPNVKLVLTSTRQIYGRPQYLPVDEGHQIEPVDVNGINKFAAEQYYNLYHKVYGIRSSILRLTNTYGPRMDLNSDSKGFMGVFFRKAIRGEGLQIFGDGLQRRDYNYVDDVVEALMIAALSGKTDGKTYNLSHPDPHSLTYFADILKTDYGVPYELIPFPEERKVIDIGDYYGTSDLFSLDTNWRPKINLKDGVSKTMNYFQEFKHMYL